MAQQIELEVAPREVMGKATRHLRREGMIPGNIFGHKEPSQAIQIDALAFERLRRSHGMRNVLSLKLPNAASQMALIRHVQRDPRTGHILHVDFSRISVGERVEVKIPLHFVGEAPGVKMLGGVLLHLMEAVAVECRATDIVEYVEVEISSLVDIDASLHARDVKLPEGYKLMIDPEEPIAKIAATRAEVATAVTEAAAEAAATTE